MNDKTSTANLVEAKSKVDDAEKAVLAITETEKGIAELKQKYGGVVFEVTTTQGMTEAKQARKEIREPRYTIEHLRKDAKAPILALGRAVDSIAADLTAQVLAIEEPIDKQIKDEEERKAEEKRLAEEAERKRIDDIKARIAKLHDDVLFITKDHKATPKYVDLCISGYMQLEIDDSYGEFREDAQRTYDAGLVALEAHSKAMTERVAEEKRQAERDAELEQLRREKEEREETDRKEAQRKAEIKAEADRKAAEAMPPPVEEQLSPLAAATIPAGPQVEPFPVGMTDVPPHRPQPPAFEQRDVKVVPPYPGSNAIVEAVVQHFNVDLQTANHWLMKYAAEQIQPTGA